MKLLIDFGSIKTGGGVQLALNFLDWIQSSSDENFPEQICLLLPELGPLASFQSQTKLITSTLTYPNNYVSRKVFELRALPEYLKKQQITHIFTFFGAGLPRFPGVKSMVSVAYPIVCYPDSPFWTFFPLKQKLIQKTLNFFRCRRIRSADCVLVETGVMKERLIKYVGVSKHKLDVFPPVPSSFVPDRSYVKPAENARLNFLFLSGLDNHKNIWRLPELASELIALGFVNFKFLISVNLDQYQQKYLAKVQGKDAILNDYFEFLGAVPARDIHSVYARANFLVNLSDLESFSNNYMEAWKVGVPLICSDTDFSHNICKKSAVYIPSHDMPEAAKIIVKFCTEPDHHSAMVTHGKSYLQELPNLSERIRFIVTKLREL